MDSSKDSIKNDFTDAEIYNLFSHKDNSVYEAGRTIEAIHKVRSVPYLKRRIKWDTNFLDLER